MQRFLSFLMAGVLASGPVQAAIFRPITTLTAPVVRLSDLFDGLESDGHVVLGPGPAAGGPIVVEAAQLAAIARQFGVDWRPRGNERAVLERAGRLLPREDVLAALRTALTGLGAPADAELDLPGYAPPLVPAETTVRSEVEQMDYDGARGRFTATLSVSGEGMLTQRQRVAGTMHEMAEVPVPMHRLAAGTILRAGDLQTARVRATQLRGEVARTPEQAVGKALRRAVLPWRCPTSRARWRWPRVPVSPCSFQPAGCRSPPRVRRLNPARSANASRCSTPPRVPCWRWKSSDRTACVSPPAALRSSSPASSAPRPCRR